VLNFIFFMTGQNKLDRLTQTNISGGRQEEMTIANAGPVLEGI
jgi:hypothetical protein